MEYRTITILACCVALLTARPAEPQEGLPGIKSVQSMRTEAPPEIDGRLDEPVWQQASVVHDLHEVSPNEYDEPSEASRFYVLHDDDFLYVGAVFQDSEPDKVVARVMRQGDFSRGEDGVKVILDPFDQGRSGYVFHLNPNGIRSEALFKNITEENWDWQGIWHGAAERNGEGWAAELAIPFKTLSFDPASDTWGINFNRSIGRRNEEIGWVSYNRSQNPANSGKLTGMSGLQQGLGLDIVPSMRATRSKDFVIPDSGTEIEPSLDVFYKPTPSMTAALTINTDFSGTSADERQINLTRFSVFFPEKRLFFLQDTDIFEFGRIGLRPGQGGGGGEQAERESARPFFSRRIGLNADGETVPIVAGLKLTGRLGRWDYGLLDVQQDESLDEDGNVVDASNLVVGRLVANVLEESNVGVIATYGDPQSNVGNSLVGVDFRYLNTRLEGGRTLEGALWYQQSDTPGLDGDDAAYGFSINAPNTARWFGEFSFKEVQENFNPALGFVNQNDIRDFRLEGGYIWRPRGSWFRSIRSGVRAQRKVIIGGDLDTEQINVDLIRFENNSGDDLGFWYQFNEENLVEPFEITDGIFIPPGNYKWERYCTRFGTGEQRVFRIGGYACDGGFYDGRRISTGPNVTWRPSEHFKLEVNYRLNDIELPAGDFITRQYTVNADIAFTSTWYWENLVQYDNVSDSLGINSILRWIPLAGREMVVVLNREFADLDENLTFTSETSDLTFKINYTFRF